MGRYVVMMKKRVKFGFGSFRSRSLRNATCTMNVSLPSELFINPSIVDIKNLYLYRTSHVIVFDVMTIYRYELKIITYVPSAVLDIPVFFFNRRCPLCKSFHRWNLLLFLLFGNKIICTREKRPNLINALPTVLVKCKI